MKAVLFFFVFSSSLFSQALEVLYEERIPYVIKKVDSLEGLAADPLLKALEKSGISYKLKQKPSSRHLFEIKGDKKAVCAIGWFKNPQREMFALYTKPLYEDKPMGIIARKDNIKVKSKKDIDMLFGDGELSLLAKKSYSYGKELDEKILKYKVKKRDVNSDNIKMLKLISIKRADYMLVSYEEAKVILEEYPERQVLEFIQLNGFPKGNKRYLICSKSTGINVIDNINKYLE